MIEVPSAALTVDLLAREADFFSIGTNDLIQYCLAVDRTDERVSGMYAPLHPAILRMLDSRRAGARRRGIPVSVCGEMAADPALLPLLAGLGLREFSMTPGAIPVAKQVRPQPADRRDCAPGAAARCRRRRPTRSNERWRSSLAPARDQR